MDIWLIWLINYWCIAFSFGISTSILILKESNAIAREIGNSTTSIDRSPILSYLLWIFMTAIFFPLVLIKICTSSIEEEIIPNLAIGLLKKPE